MTPTTPNGYVTAQLRPPRWRRFQTGQSLLRGSEGGGVGGGATHDADGVAYGDAEKQGYQHGHDSPYEYDAKPQQVEFQPSLAEGAEEAGRP